MDAGRLKGLGFNLDDLPPPSPHQLFKCRQFLSFSGFFRLRVGEGSPQNGGPSVKSNLCLQFLEGLLQPPPL